MTVVKNENNELIRTATIIGWQMCIDYQKLNKTTRKDHFSLPFIDQMLERLTKNSYFCHLDGYSGSFKCLFTQMTKKRRLLHVHMARMLIDNAIWVM